MQFKVNLILKIEHSFYDDGKYLKNIIDTF